MSEQDRSRFQEESDCFIRQRFSHSSNKFDARMQNVQMATARKPATGYLIFAKQVRERIKLLEQDLTTKELMRLIGREWAKLSPEEK